tara:strand:+ start:128 stop:844 length:717 start_codon:yes stop_codon:yes gene_type:complete
MKKILIATATYNEVKNIEKLVSKIKKLRIDNMNFFVVDDNSPDGTPSIIKKLKNKYNWMKYRIRPKKLGLNTAYKAIYNFAYKHKYKYLITLDADLSHNANDIKRFIPLLDKYDFVIGSRYMKGGKCSMKFSRFILSYFGNLFIKIVLKTKINEHTNSFRGFNLAKLNKKKIDLKKINSSGYSFFMETIYQLKKNQCSIKEIPITFRDRKFGKSKIPRLEIFRTLTNLFKLKFFSYFK